MGTCVPGRCSGEEFGLWLGPSRCGRCDSVRAGRGERSGFVRRSRRRSHRRQQDHNGGCRHDHESSTSTKVTRGPATMTGSDDDLNVIVTRDSNGTSRQTPVTCDGFTTFPTSALADPVPIEDSGDAAGKRARQAHITAPPQPIRRKSAETHARRADLDGSRRRERRHSGVSFWAAVSPRAPRTPSRRGHRWRARDRKRSCP
jgi:hypothetical protein